MNKIGNTLKMMGVSGKDALLFEDAHKCYHLTVGVATKTAYRNQMLNTVIMGKTIKQWFEHYIKISQKMGIQKESSLPHENQFTAKDFYYTIKDFDFDMIEISNVNILLDLIVQEYYRKEKII